MLQPAPDRRGLPIGSDIRHEPGGGRVLLGQDQGLPNANLLKQCGLDFSQFDAKAAHFDLMVSPTEILDVPVACPSREISRSVETSSAKWILDKTFLGQIRASPVSVRHTGSADVNLAGNPNRNELPLGVEEPDLQVRDWASNRTF